jgi:hypothetical protein
MDEESKDGPLAAVSMSTPKVDATAWQEKEL